MSPFSESTGGDRRSRSDLVPIWFRFGCSLRSALFHAGQCFRTLGPGSAIQATFSTHFGPKTATLGAGFCDSYTLSILFRILGWDPGRWIRRQLHTFDTFSELHRIGFHRICDTGHIFHTIWIHILDPGLGPWALDLVTVIHFSHIGLWISHIYTSFHTFGPDRIGSDRSGSNSDESLCVDPIVKNPYVWIQ